MEVEVEEIDDNFEDCSDSATDPDNLKFNRYALTLAERIAVIKEYENGKKVSHLPEMFGCSKAQIGFILKHRKEYEAEWQKDCSNPQRVRRPISPHILVIGIILFEYVWRLRHYPIEVTDDMLKEAGKIIGDKLELKNFRTTKRWLERFKHCYRLENSILLSANVINDGQKKKSADLNNVFRDIDQQLRLKNVTITNLSEDHLIPLKATRSAMLNESLRVDPRLIRKQPRSFRKNSSDSLLKQESTNEDEPEVEYVEILSDPYESEVSKSRPNSSLAVVHKNGYSSNIKEIQNYKDALEHLKALEEFAFAKEDLRAIGLVNHLENYYKERIEGGEV